MNTTATYQPKSFKDPTGLEPESEKGGEDRMLTNAVQDLLEESFAAENAMQAMFADMRALKSWNIFCSEYGIDVYTGQMWSNYMMKDLEINIYIIIHKGYEL